MTTHLIVEAAVRYWEDAVINDQEDVEGTLIPLRRGEDWTPIIELATGRILGWPTGTEARIHYKVCDGGSYWLGDAEGNKIAKWRGYYVPDDFLCVGSRGHGDYIILRVGPQGFIAGWKPPRVDPAQWEPVKTIPHLPGVS